MPQHQRKFRNRVEREEVCRGVAEQAVSCGLPLDSEPMTALLSALERYAADESGATFQGSIPADELRRDSVLEYSLPGRRVTRPMVRLTSRPTP